MLIYEAGFTQFKDWCNAIILSHLYFALEAEISIRTHVINFRECWFSRTGVGKYEYCSRTVLLKIFAPIWSKVPDERKVNIQEEKQVRSKQRRKERKVQEKNGKECKTSIMMAALASVISPYFPRIPEINVWIQVESKDLGCWFSWRTNVSQLITLW